MDMLGDLVWNHIKKEGRFFGSSPGVAVALNFSFGAFKGAYASYLWGCLCDLFDYLVILNKYTEFKCTILTLTQELGKPSANEDLPISQKTQKKVQEYRLFCIISYVFQNSDVVLFSERHSCPVSCLLLLFNKSQHFSIIFQMLRNLMAPGQDEHVARSNILLLLKNIMVVIHQHMLNAFTTKVWVMLKPIDMEFVLHMALVSGGCLALEYAHIPVKALGHKRVLALEDALHLSSLILLKMHQETFLTSFPSFARCNMARSVVLSWLLDGNWKKKPS
ncbi:hypothetical protein BUALT_Bualt01G0223400 [Buddleja alternifolia]|uniref:Uncharacterized protein n=1 Tax=Buddleja alternifolia TaxID=168488 RepID=A0AAV6YAU3_9LAMI|nr:hypothetical protein BUALT_Bualt01G0223400 [Buddleja alternifolia]